MVTVRISLRVAVTAAALLQLASSVTDATLTSMPCCDAGEAAGAAARRSRWPCQT